MQQIIVSAIICSHNRAQYLPGAIESLVSQSLSKQKFEIIVVDNRSTDNTKALVFTDFCHVNHLKYLYEPILGLSQARNTGWLNARGKYVAFLDDDAVADSQWLEKILDVFDNVNLSVGAVGGKIDPMWESPRPAWLSHELNGCLGILNWSERPTVLKEDQWLGGGNICYPKYLLETVGGFETSLGRKGTKLLSNEEILLRQQLDQLGYCHFYHPEIAVSHHIPASRLTKSWFVRRCFWQGVSEAITQLHFESPAAKERLRMIRSAGQKLLVSLRELSHLVASKNDTDLFAMVCTNLAKIGYFLGLLGI